MQILHSIKRIEKRYNTGEEPVLVACNNHNSYICKYSRYSGSANKLVCELLGAEFARTWGIDTPETAFVKVLPAHVPNDLSGSYFANLLLGSLQKKNVIDITPTSVLSIPSDEKLCKQLLRIALFDFWIANEDRNANNANLMYDVVERNIIAIDYGCCFNTATFEYPLCQLTETDSILNSDLFDQVRRNISKDRILQMAEVLTRIDFMSYIHNCKTTALITKWDENILEEGWNAAFIPSLWNINREILTHKVEELIDTCWTNKVQENFNETLNTILNNE